MIKIYDLKEMPIERIFERRAQTPEDKVTDAVREIIDDIRANGDKSLLEYTKKFDKADITDLEVSQEEIDEAFNTLDERFKQILMRAAENIRAFHSLQKKDSFEMKKEGGIVLGQKCLPMKRAGVYVPGGTASYPSSVLMNIIPAKIAGVEETVMVSPPKADGKIPAPILAAAKIAGADKIYKCGGAQAIAALAYGTKSIKPVDKIVGPGNAYVACAKRLVYGKVDIDMIAGPSEILVIADETACPRHVAADMLSQAEHDKNASAVLICLSREFADKTAKELEQQLKELPREEIARASVENNGKVIIAKDMTEAVAAANEIAPEHLEIAAENAFDILPQITNAGSIFLGKNVPEALGDYYAGPNHTLPTSGTARFSSPLSVYDFLKRSSYIYYPEQALKEVAEEIEYFAHAEGLDAHARSIASRFGDEK